MIFICFGNIVISIIVLLIFKYREVSRNKQNNYKNLYDFDEVLIELIELVISTICYIVIVASALYLLWQFIF